MSMITQPLREEHKELIPHIEAMRRVADAIGETNSAALQQGVDEVIEFLTHHLIPHAEAEERALYPVVAEVMGAPQATRTMSRDHVEVGRLTEELVTLRAKLSGATLDPIQTKALRRVLYGLYALVKVHFAKEEEIYLPLLDAKLSVKEAKQMFQAMEAAAHEAKAHAAH
ncbi:MAG TPA: hemerythrin domain-containing protein [Caldilineaceae bacterium]|nr:hemerythrin domain-containing protein [Caldilineaceae bacterium]